jgi:ribonucleoside-diphosphate reductase alpha chain
MPRKKAAQKKTEALPSETQPQRKRLPTTRSSVTHKFQIAEQKGYIIVGLYEDGRPGEVFLKIGKEGSTLGGMFDTVGILTSIALQHGVPLETLAEKLAYVRFEPSGWTKNPKINHAHSIVDYVFRWLQSEFEKPKKESGNA